MDRDLKHFLSCALWSRDWGRAHGSRLLGDNRTFGRRSHVRAKRDAPTAIRSTESEERWKPDWALQTNRRMRIMTLRAAGSLWRIFSRVWCQDSICVESSIKYALWPWLESPQVGQGHHRGAIVDVSERDEGRMVEKEGMLHSRNTEFPWPWEGCEGGRKGVQG